MLTVADNQKIRHLQEIELLHTIFQSFSFTLYKSYTFPLIQTFCARPNSFHLRVDCSLCNTRRKPLATKIQCYTVLISLRLSHEIIRMQFSSRTLKMVRTYFLDSGSVTKKNIYHLYVKKIKIAKLGN